MRIITEDNVDQLMNLSYSSGNLDKLLNYDTDNNKNIKNMITRYADSLKIAIDNKRRVLNIDVNEYAADAALEYSNSTDTSPPGGTPLSDLGNPPSLNGGANVFPNNPEMNDAFNRLKGETQAKILQMPSEQRYNVMGQIMARTSQQQQQQMGGNGLGGGKLSPYFERLPLDKQFIALQNGYNSMSKEFSNLAKVAPDPLITIKKPLSIQEQFNNQLITHSFKII
jgi:hypothetical protein